MENFNGELVKLARESKGMMQKSLAKKIGVNQATLSKYELCMQEPSEERIKKLSEILDFPVNFFYQEYEDYNVGLSFNIPTIPWKYF